MTLIQLKVQLVKNFQQVCPMVCIHMQQRPLLGHAATSKEGGVQTAFVRIRGQHEELPIFLNDISNILSTNFTFTPKKLLPQGCRV